MSGYYKFYFTHDDSDIDPNPERTYSAASKDLSIDRPQYNTDFRFMVPLGGVRIVLLYSMPEVLVPHPGNRWPGFFTEMDLRWDGKLYITLANPDIAWRFIATRVSSDGTYIESYASTNANSGGYTGLRTYLGNPCPEHINVPWYHPLNRLQFHLMCIRNSNKGSLDFGIGLGDWGAYLDFTVGFPLPKKGYGGKAPFAYIEAEKTQQDVSHAMRASGEVVEGWRANGVSGSWNATGVSGSDVAEGES